MLNAVVEKLAVVRARHVRLSVGELNPFRHCLCFAWYVERRRVSWSRLRLDTQLCVRVHQRARNDMKGMVRRHWYCEARGEIL